MRAIPKPAESSLLAVVVEELGAELFRKSGAEEFGISENEFCCLLREVGAKCLAARTSAKQARQFYEDLHLTELTLARACAAGHDAAWEKFVVRYREELYAMALHIAKEDSAAHDLADSVYAELFGLRSREGQRVSKLASYTGRGSLEGWLRTVLAQQYIDRYRVQKRLVSLEDEADEVPSVAIATSDVDSSPVDPRLKPAVDAALETLSAEEKFLLASYYLDQRTLMEIAAMLGMHASSVSRRLDKLAAAIRKRILAELVGQGMDRRQAEELMEVDVRDLEVNVRQHLLQKTEPRSFSDKRVRPQASSAPE